MCSGDTCISTCTCICTYMYMYIHVYVHTCICTYYVCILDMYICIVHVTPPPPPLLSPPPPFPSISPSLYSHLSLFPSLPPSPLPPPPPSPPHLPPPPAAPSLSVMTGWWRGVTWLLTLLWRRRTSGQIDTRYTLSLHVIIDTLYHYNQIPPQQCYHYKCFMDYMSEHVIVLHMYSV